MTATFTQAQCQAACDNIGKAMVDAVATIPTTVGLTAITSDFGTEITRILALTDQIVEPALIRAWTHEQRSVALGNLAAGRLLTYLNTVTYAQLLSSGPYEVCDALEFAAVESGSTSLAAFLATNTTVVDVYFADIFNAFVSAVKSGSYTRVYMSATPVTIPSTSVFPHTTVDYIDQFTLTSTTAGTLASGTASLAALQGGNTIPGGGTLEAYAGTTIGASGYTITVTYTSIAGVTGQTITCTVPVSASLNTIFTPSLTVQAVSIQTVAITTGTGTTGDKINFRLNPVRTITA